MGRTLVGQRRDAYLPAFGRPAFDPFPKDVYLVVDELLHFGVCDAGLWVCQYRVLKSTGRGEREMDGLTMVTSSTSNVCGLTVPKRR